MSRLLSTTRLPLDHFVSGALVGAIVGLSRGGVKTAAKFAAEGAIATSFAVMASNQIAAKNYTSAALTTLLGVGALALSEKFLKEE